MLYCFITMLSFFPCQELRIVFPNAQRLNRGNYEMKQLLDACRANGVTDFIMVHEHRGQPDALIISHLPYGPTAYFNISDVVMRHDIPDIGNIRFLYSDYFLLTIILML